MATLLQPLIERVERLLLRHQELQRTNDLLTQQVAQITQERDALKSRLQTARHRIDALLERLPEESTDRKSTRLNSSHT